MSAADDLRKAIGAAVSRVDAVQISPGVARGIVEWLGELAEIRRRTNGCPPIGLVEVQQAIAEACAAVDDSHRASIKAIPALSVTQSLVTVKDAAAVLGVEPTTVRYHYKAGNLTGRKIGETLMIASDSLEQFRAHRADKRSA